MMKKSRVSGTVDVVSVKFDSGTEVAGGLETDDFGTCPEWAFLCVGYLGGKARISRKISITYDDES